MQLLGMLDVLTATNSVVACANNLSSFHMDLTWPSNDDACAANTSFSADKGLGPDDVHIDYDSDFFSYVGCRCMAGYDNIYVFDSEGNLYTPPQQSSVLKCAYCHLRFCLFEGICMSGMVLILG